MLNLFETLLQPNKNISQRSQAAPIIGANINPQFVEALGNDLEEKRQRADVIVAVDCNVPRKHDILVGHSHAGEIDRTIMRLHISSYDAENNLKIGNHVFKTLDLHAIGEMG
ncbi:uncharacterized protein CTRU02_206267 [Colletotrichum truncatum]|uniref:Uncharacterized protein n=1 Tax=Colletotrichum truncatum TaxID=5467 RepID=A0ACC3Z6G0_COLTU|nr:uncharacterized protein CTRU02_09895 [Colletotrichum truncatum]KAF6788082.1 hypothetical protein CTRU02_09895 [Colletotrichum truncatum]